MIRIGSESHVAISGWVLPSRTLMPGPCGPGCDDGQRVYLGLRNGFQVQMRIFTKP
jgi:hypothetical protein